MVINVPLNSTMQSVVPASFFIVVLLWLILMSHKNLKIVKILLSKEKLHKVRAIVQIGYLSCSCPSPANLMVLQACHEQSLSAEPRWNPEHHWVLPKNTINSLLPWSCQLTLLHLFFLKYDFKVCFCVVIVAMVTTRYKTWSRITSKFHSPLIGWIADKY